MKSSQSFIQKIWFYLFLLTVGILPNAIGSTTDSEEKQTDHSVQTAQPTTQEKQIDYFAEMAQNTELGQKVKDFLFSAKHNKFCRSSDGFCPLQCHYDTQRAYEYFTGNHEEWSLIPSLSFATQEELDRWACNAQDVFLVAYKPGCPPCANLLAAIETRAKDLQASGMKIYKVNVRENNHGVFFDDEAWNFTGTPTVWKINKGTLKQVNASIKDYYDLFIKLREENFVGMQPQPISTSSTPTTISRSTLEEIWSHGFGEFEHDGKVALTAASCVLMYTAYRGYQKAKQWHYKSPEKSEDPENQESER